MQRHSFQFVALSVLFTALSIGCDAPKTTLPDGTMGTVTLRFQANGQTIADVDVPEVADGVSLESVMRDLEGIEVDISGAGSTAFVTSIDGIATSATEGWTFKVDDQFANYGIGQTVLHPPTTVEWSFGGFQE